MSLEERVRYVEAKVEEHGVAIADLRTLIVGLDQKLDRRFDALEARLDRRFDTIDARFTAIDARFDTIDARFDAIDARFTAIDARFTTIDTRFTNIEARFTGIDNHIGAMETRSGYWFLSLVSLQIGLLIAVIAGLFRIVTKLM